MWGIGRVSMDLFVVNSRRTNSAVAAIRDGWKDTRVDVSSMRLRV